MAKDSMQMDERDIEDLTVSKFAVGLLPRGQITSSPILLIIYNSYIFSQNSQPHPGSNPWFNFCFVNLVDKKNEHIVSLLQNLDELWSR